MIFKNKNGVAVLFGVVVAVMIFLSGMLFVNYFFNDITLATGTNQLDCDNPIITDGTKLTCLGIDLVIPYFIILVLSAAGGVIASKVMA